MIHRTQTEMKKNQRRTVNQYIIDPFKQVTFGLYYVSLNLVSFFVLAALFWGASMRQYAQLIEIFSVMGDDRSKIMLNDVFHQNLILLGTVFLGLTVATIAMTVWLTYRIYGPQVAIVKFVREVSRGNYHARLKLRNNDEFHELADELNQMASNLRRGNEAELATLKGQRVG